MSPFPLMTLLLKQLSHQVIIMTQFLQGIGFLIIILQTDAVTVKLQLGDEQDGTCLCIFPMVVMNSMRLFENKIERSLDWIMIR